MRSSDGKARRRLWFGGSASGRETSDGDVPAEALDSCMANILVLLRSRKICLVREVQENVSVDVLQRQQTHVLSLVSFREGTT